MNLSAMLDKMVVLFIAILVGYLITKLGVINRDANKVLSALIVNLANPLLILSSVMTDERLLTNVQVLELTGVAALCYAFLIGTSFLIPRMLRAPKQDAGIYRFMYIFSNIGYIGYPVVSALFGPSAVFYATVFVLLFQVLCWSYGVHLVRGEGRFRFSFSVMKSPCVIAALLAYVIYFTGLRLPAVLEESVSFLGSLTTPMCMLVIGCSLAQMPLKTVFSRWRVYVLAAVKMLLVPVLAYALLHRFVTNELILGVTIVILSMPVATNVPIICCQCNQDEDLGASGVFLTTLLSIGSIPLIMQLLFGA